MKIIRPLIFCHRPGYEVYNLGGFLSKLKYKRLSKKLSNQEDNKTKPRVVYSIVRSQKEIEEIKKISSLLGFTYEIFYSRGFDKSLMEVKEDLKRKIKGVISFYRPDCVFSVFDEFSDKDINTDISVLGDSVAAVSHGSVIPFFGFGYYNNLLIDLDPGNIADKKKALAYYRTFTKDDFSIIDNCINNNNMKDGYYEMVNLQFANCDLVGKF